MNKAHMMESTNFQLTDDVDDGGDLSMQDPMKLLVQLNEKYHRQKTLYKMTRDYYYKLNLFVFYLPLLIVQGLTTVLTHMSGRPVIPQHDKIKIIVAILNGMSSVWTAAQLKLGRWNQKTQSANSTLIKYRDMSAHVAMFLTILKCQKEMSPKGMLMFVESCYDNEKSIMQNEITVPPFIVKRYDSGEITPDDTTGNMAKHIEKEDAKKAAKEAKKSKKKKKASVEDNPKMGEAGTELDVTNVGGQGEEDAPLISKPGGETSKPASGASGDNKEKDAKAAGEETEGEDEDEDDGDEDSNVNGKQLFMNLLSRYRALKWLYGHAARYYYLLNLTCFYTPLVIFGTLNTILTSLTVDDKDSVFSMVVIKISAVTSILTGLQMQLQWESESAKCEKTFQMYRRLDSEITYRMMLADQGVPVKNAAKFAWKCRDVEDQTVDDEPAIPQFIVAQVTQEALQEQRRLFQGTGDVVTEKTSSYL
ncbi:uncharacterized protein LOC134844295 isoform X3 [Symsagittifera roscoffensis]|uniref:uncharacterized protein LOC134844295 isoform X3 n=1 Tax=Symsagittifera roscoffensis TaxID=84072 RepID=UPI00307C039D